MIQNDASRIDDLLEAKKIGKAFKLIKKHYIAGSNQDDFLYYGKSPFVDTNNHRVYLTSDFSGILGIEKL